MGDEEEKHHLSWWIKAVAKNRPSTQRQFWTPGETRPPLKWGHPNRVTVCSWIVPVLVRKLVNFCISAEIQLLPGICGVAVATQGADLLIRLMALIATTAKILIIK